MKVGDKIMTNNNCDSSNEVGTIEKINETKDCVIIKLDNGRRIMTMAFAVDLIS